MNRTLSTVVLASALVAGLAGPAAGHPGNTNRYGCHAGTQPYHCHNGGSVSAPAPVVVRAPVVSAPRTVVAPPAPPVNTGIAPPTQQGATAPAGFRRLSIDLDPDGIYRGSYGRVWVAGYPGEMVLLYANGNLVRRSTLNGNGLTSYAVKPGVNTVFRADPDKGPSARNSDTLTMQVVAPGTALPPNRPGTSAGAPAPAPAPAPVPAPVVPVAPPAPVVPPVTAPTETTSQANAVRTARSYIEFSGFSRTGLIRQLEFEGYSNADAAYAVDRLNLNFDAQAVRVARSYLEISGFSRSGLIRQLEFEGFTPAQAAFAATSVGLQ